MNAPGRWFACASTCALILGVSAVQASAQGGGVKLDLGDADQTGYIKLVLLFASVSLAPALVAVLTSFARIIVVLFFLRVGLGAQEIPPNLVLIGLAILLTLVTMLPTLGDIYDHAVGPMLRDEISLAEAGQDAAGPLRRFMSAQVRAKDLDLMLSLASLPASAGVGKAPMSVLASAFALSELRTAFLVGFVVYLPFIIIDLVVASTLASIGMLSLPAPMLALPFKILLFVMVDGWSLLAQALVSTYR